MSTELIVLEKLELIPFFTKGDNVDALLAQIKAEADSQVFDASTSKGRKEIKSYVTKITKSKTYLEKHGKELAAEYKAIPKQIDANRKKVKDFLNAVQDKARLALTEYEDKQKQVEADQLAKYEELKKLLATEDDFYTPYSSVVLNNNLIDLQSLTVDKKGYGDYELSALKAQLKGVPDLEKAISDILHREAMEAEQREADKLAAEQAQKEREEQAALAATQEAERIAAYNAEQAEIAAKNAIEQAELAAKQAELDKIAAEEKASQEAIAAKKREEQYKINAEIFAKQAEEQVLADKIAAEKKAEADRQQAIVNEKNRVAAEQKRIDDDAADREADTKHKGKINRAAMSAIMKCGADEAAAKKIIGAIYNGLIPNVKINY